MTEKELDHLLMKSKQVPTVGCWYDTVTGEGEPCVNVARPDEYHGVIICKNGQILNNWIMNYIAEACNAAPELIKEIKHLRRMVYWLATQLAYPSQNGEKWKGYLDDTERWYILFNTQEQAANDWVAAAKKASENEA